MNLKLLLSTAKKYGAKSFSTKSFLVFFVVLSVPFILFALFISYQYRDNVLESYNNVINESNSKAAECFNVMNDSIDTYHRNISASNDIAIVLCKIDFNNSITKNAIEGIKKSIEEFLTVTPIVSSVYIYSATNNYVFSGGDYNTSCNLERFFDKSLIENSDYQKQIFSRTAKPKNQQKEYLTIQIPFWSQSVNKGLLFVNIDIENIKRELKSVNSYMLYFSLYDDAKNLIISSMENSADNNSDKNVVSHITDSVFHSPIDSRGQYYSYAKIANNDTLFFSNENSNYQKSMQKHKVVLFIAVLILLLINVIVSAILTLYFYQYIAMLTIAFETPNSLSDNQLLKLKSHNEISFLLNTVIKNSKSSYVEDEYQKRIKSLEKQHLLNLQTQISPHFISNTLNGINSVVMATFKKQTIISTMIIDLSKLLKYTLHMNDNIVTLKTELENLKYYIELEKIRCNNKFDIVYNIAEETLNNKIIKLSIQPFIENAIFHGLKINGGIIEISSYYEDDDFIIKIRDTGGGISSELLCMIQNELNNTDRVFEIPDNYIGIINTHRRINILFGSHYGCRLESDMNSTTVYMIFPKS